MLNKILKSKKIIVLTLLLHPASYILIIFSFMLFGAFQSDGSFIDYPFIEKFLYITVLLYSCAIRSINVIFWSIILFIMCVTVASVFYKPYKYTFLAAHIMTFIMIWSPIIVSTSGIGNVACEP
jgi:hypothetical protein